MEMKLYYVKGYRDYGRTMPHTVKTYALTPAGARWNAGYVLAYPGKVTRG